MTRMDYVTINYANLEKVVIPTELIIDFHITGITSSIQSVGDTLIGRREVAEYIGIQIKEFKDLTKKIEEGLESDLYEDELQAELHKYQSELYSDITPYDKIKHDTTVVFFTLHFTKIETGEKYTEEVYVPYLNKTPDTIGENELLTITEKVIERPYYESEKGVELKFNAEAYPY